MSKHTKGPWRVKPLPSNVDGCREIQAGKSGDFRQAQWRYGIASTHGRDPDSEDEANARLIASAPDLLEALKQAVEWMDEEGCDCGTDDPPCALCFANAVLVNIR